MSIKIEFMKISAVIVAHNEQENIRECLQSLDFADEIVVVLDKCSDNTKEIVLEYTDKIIEGSWKIEGARRNMALKAASHEWILEIDADERISLQLKQEIMAAIKNNTNCGFDIPIANCIGKRWIKHGWLRTLGVLKRQSLTYHGLKKYDEDKEIHPTFRKNFPIKSLKNPIMHLVDENVADLLSRFNRYTTWKANDMLAHKKVKNRGFVHFFMVFISRFFKSYFTKKGYKEGSIGVLIAILAALYPLISYIKAKEILAQNENH